MENQDSKVSRSFLRMVLKELGKPVPEELSINSWEMFDLVAKDIQLMKLEISRMAKTIQKMQRAGELSKQCGFTFQDARELEYAEEIRKAIKTYVENK